MKILRETNTSIVVKRWRLNRKANKWNIPVHLKQKKKKMKKRVYLPKNYFRQFSDEKIVARPNVVGILGKIGG